MINFNPISYLNKDTRKISAPKPRQISFCARTEYDYLEKNYDVRTSNYFRRGNVSGAQREEFKNVIDAIEDIFSEEKKPQILVVGLGEAQEPFSLLAVVKNLKKNIPVCNALDLNCVDLQPQIPNRLLTTYSYLDSTNKPMFAQDSFEYIQNPEYPKYHYKVKDDIIQYLQEIFNNPDKTKWDTKIEEFAQTCPKRSYDMIFINNVLGYIEDRNKAASTVENIAQMLKKGGILVTDTCDDFYRKSFNCLKDFKNLNPGIWKNLI